MRHWAKENERKKKLECTSVTQPGREESMVQTSVRKKAGRRNDQLISGTCRQTACGGSWKMLQLSYYTYSSQKSFKIVCLPNHSRDAKLVPNFVGKVFSTIGFSTVVHSLTVDSQN